MTIGQRIRLRREELNISQEDLAKKIGYKSRSSINKIELDLYNLKQSKIKLIADALDTTPAFIMGWEDDEDKSIISDTVFDRLKESFDKLNDKGKDEALKRVEELTLIPTYTEEDEEYDFLVAAHIKDDADPDKAEEEKLRLIAKYRPDKK